MNSPFRSLRQKALTWIELLVLLVVIGALAIVALAPLWKIERLRMVGRRVSDGLNLYKALGNYASDPNKDEFPAYKNPDDPSTLVHTSSEAFEVLLEYGMLESKALLFNPNSAWCRHRAQNVQNARQVLPGENDWCYVRGIKWESRNHRWPILANAFAPDSTTYVADQSQKGGVWKGKHAVVIWAGGSGEVVETKERDGRYFVPRPGQPEANAFARDGAWLSEDGIEVLHPAP